MELTNKQITVIFKACVMRTVCRYSGFCKTARNALAIFSKQFLFSDQTVSVFLLICGNICIRCYIFRMDTIKSA